MAKGRLHFDGDNVGIEKEARIYSLTDDVERKINSIPNVIDNTSSTSATDALSANMGRDLQEQINNLASRGRYLSTWNAEIGLPDTNPQVSPYVYRAGDYYIVSKIVSGTNYRPHGSSYVTGEASTDVETESISVNDLYIYDGAQWIRQGSGSGATTTWGSIVGVLSNQTDLQNALDTKQDELTAGEGISIDANNVISNTLPGAIVDATAPSNPSQGDLWYDTTNNKLKTFDGTQWNETGVTYTAGANIQINGTTISATDTKYTAGNNINISGTTINARDTEYEAGNNITITCPTESDMKGPCPSGFHVPSESEGTALCDIMHNLGTTTQQALKMQGVYWTTKVVSWGQDGKAILADRANCVMSSRRRSGYYYVRPFKNVPVVPDNTWTTLFDGSSVAAGAGTFRNQVEGLISMSDDGINWITIADKNIGATQVWNEGDTETQANSGGIFLQGNNYMFPKSGPTKTITDKVDVRGYGPGNYYYSDVGYSGDSNTQWDKVGQGSNLWGGVTQGTWQDCEHPIISATGGATYTAGNGINIDANNEITADTTVLATKTDLTSKQDTLTAGENIQIDTTTNTISATDTTYNAGENITIEDVCTTESDMKGPCPSGFHVPLNTEWQAVYDIWTALGGGSSDGTNFEIALKLPEAGYRSSGNSKVNSQGSLGTYWSSSRRYDNYAFNFYFYSSYINPQNSGNRTFGYSVRCFKNAPVIPTSSWTKLYGTSIEAGGIFWSSTDGLISLSSNGATWITIADKNLGATTVWNSGDTLSEANCGKYYQRGNNYGFPRTGTIASQSTTQVDARNYGPGNYYSSDTFIKYNGRWDTTDNGNLWGGVSQGTHQECIHNVISSTDTTYTAGNGISIDANNEISVDNTIARAADVNTKTFYLSSASDLTTAQAALDWYKSGNNPIVSYNDEMYYFKEYQDSFYKKLWFYKDSLDVLELGDYTMINRLKLGFDLDDEGTTVTGIRDYNYDTIANLLDTSTDYSSPYTPVYDGNPATKKYVDDSVSGAVSKGTTAPSSPVEGQLWYDTTNDVLKVYDGTNWNIVGDDAADINTKTFFISGTVEEKKSKLGQAIQYYLDGKNPILSLGNTTYTLRDVVVGDFELGTNDVYTFSSTIKSENGKFWEIVVDVLVTAQGHGSTVSSFTDTKHSAGAVVSGAAPSNPAQGDMWYDTTNDVLKIYDGTNWNNVNTDTTYTAGTGINIDQNDEISVDNTVARTSDTYRRFDVKNPAIYQSEAIAEVQEIYDYINNHSQPVVVSCMGANFMTPLIDVTNSILYIGGRDNTYHSLFPYPLENYSLLTCPFDSNGNILSVTYTNTQAQSPIITSGTAPVGQEGLLWYDTTNNLLKIYTGTTWISTGSSITYTAGNGINIDANNKISADTTVVATQADIANFFDKTSDDADDIDDTNSTNKFVTATEKSTWSGKQDAIQDLSTIRSNATAGAGAATTIAGYGDVVSHDANEFATATQGAKADTALQSGDNISELANDAGYITSSYHDNTKQDKLIAGANIQIASDGKTISATDTTYTAGTGLSLSGTQFSVDSTVVALQSDLANYYTTSQTYSKTEVDNLISSFGSFTVVDTLPTAASADEKTIYLLGPIGTGADKYEEWIITRGAGNWASTTTMYPFTVNKNAWDGAIFIDSQTSPLSDFHGDCYVGAKLTSIGDETKLPVKLSFRASSSVDSEWVGLNEPAFAYNPDQYPNGDDLDIYIPNTSSSNRVSITAEGVMSSSPITREQGPKQWTKIGETSVDLTNYLNTSTQTSDVITEGSTNLFLTSAERTKIANSITGMTILSYGNSTWQDFIDAYSNNRVVYCRASSNSDPSTGSQGRLAFMAYVNNASNPTEVEFQYYRSRSSHSTAANVLDEVYVYKLVPSNGGTWTVTQRDTAAKPIAGTGIGLTYNASGMTISADTTTLATKTDLNSKQDTLVSGTNIKTVNNESLLGTGNITISAPTYTAGDNVQISSSNVISATDTKYNAGEGISIGNVTKNGRQGPSPKGFHVPSATEWQGVKTIMDGLSLTDGNDWKTNLHMPYAGIRVYGDAAINFQGNGGYYWASTPHETSAGNRLSMGSGFARTDGYDWRSNANSIRSFKDSYETPDSNWTVIQGTLGSAGIFWNQSEGLISITDGTTGYTIMDKNLGATVVYNNGNTLSQANMGNLYQWGNNYGFPSTGTITNTSSTQVDASGYGPTNPYSSETYIIGSTDWSSVQNDDLWGDTTGTYTQENVISNTVINSIQSSGPINVKKIWAGTTAQYNALSTYDADTIYIKVD